MTPDFQTDLALILAYLERQYVPPAERDAMRRLNETMLHVIEAQWEKRYSGPYVGAIAPEPAMVMKGEGL